MKIYVSSAPYGADTLAPVRSWSKLLAKGADKVVDSAVASIRVASKGKTAQAFSANNFAGRGSQSVEDIEFCCSALDGLTYALHCP